MVKKNIWFENNSVILPILKEFQTEYTKEIKEHSEYFKKHNLLNQKLTQIQLLDTLIEIIKNNRKVSQELLINYKTMIDEYQSEYHKYKPLLYLTLKFGRIKSLKALIKRIYSAYETININNTYFFR